MKHLIKTFQREMEDQILMEYKKNGKVNTKIILLALDDEKSPVLCYKNIPSVCQNTDDEFYDKWVKSQKMIKKLIRNVTNDGYDVISTYEMEYVEDDDGEYVFTRLNQGPNFKETTIKNYSIKKEPSIISENGSITMSVPTLEEMVDEF